MEPGAPLEVRLARLLGERGLTLATAESCTGGLVAHRITAVPGSSAYYLGGVVAYSNALKQRFLDVPEAILTRFGAVSRECAAAMSQGACARIGADLALATTGIAGPSGATPSKPVGLVYIACCAPWGTNVQRHQFTGDRGQNIRDAATAALALAITMLEPS